MKNYYKIHEISKLYGIGVDSLRYYEKLGILKPRRDTNGYRLYSLKDMYKLNIIRDLRRLDFSMQQIKEYLDGQSVENTLDLLNKEQEMLKCRQEELKRREEIIRERMVSLTSSVDCIAEMPAVRKWPERRCVQLNEHMTRDEEMDFAIKKLHSRHEARIRDLGNLETGAFFSMEDLKKGLTNVYNSVFFILEWGMEEYDFVLPEGMYLSYCYRGAYEQNRERVEEMLSYAGSHGLKVVGEPFEIYKVDNRYTVKTEEFLTEIQVLVQEMEKGQKA